MRTIASLLLLAWSPLLLSQETDTSKIAGNWQGTLKIQSFEFRQGLTVKSDAGKVTATMTSIDQGNAVIPVDTVELKDGQVKLMMAKVLARFEGKLSADGKEIEGTFYQSGLKIPLTLKKVDQLTKPNRPQEPKPPFPYRSEEVVYENNQAKVKLAGTLTIPEGKGPPPAVLLTTGSGPQDRDESLLGHKPFLVLADHLSRNGIVVLRVDDRGIGKSTGKFAEATSFDFADDALAGVQFLKTRSEVDVKRIGLAGHSEGGVIAPIVATKSKDVAYIVLLAGTGITGEQILYMQGRLIAEAGGAKPQQLEANEAIQRKLFALIKSEPASKELVVKLKKIMEVELDNLPAELKKEMEKMGRDTALKQLERFGDPWFKTFIIHDPATVLRNVKCPVLALNGEKDLQVPCQENLQAIEKALKEGGNSRVTIKAFPMLNHLFQKCTTGNVTEYVQIEETMNVEVLQTVADWIKKQ